MQSHYSPSKTARLCFSEDLPIVMSARFAPQPDFQHGQAPLTGVLYCNLGTPDSPTTADVRRFLAEFLSDPRVVEIPRLLWLMILHGIILRVRPSKSAAKYASIWTQEIGRAHV